VKELLPDADAKPGVRPRKNPALHDRRAVDRERLYVRYLFSLFVNGRATTEAFLSSYVCSPTFARLDANRISSIIVAVG
jgi:hypothetical protein